MQYLQNQMSLQAIKAQSNHVDILTWLESHCFATPWSQENCISEIDNAEVFILYQNESPIGYASLGACGDQVELRRLAIHPHFRRQGFAKKLLEQMIRHAHQRGYHEMILEVAENNQAARELYTTMGFVTYHQRSKYYTDGSAAICMRLVFYLPS